MPESTDEYLDDRFIFPLALVLRNHLIPDMAFPRGTSPISLTPGLSPVVTALTARKPLKRLMSILRRFHRPEGRC
jgi:hypothetical protein